LVLKALLTLLGHYLFAQRLPRRHSWRRRTTEKGVQP
jgi:hypothetical protein